MIKRSVILIVLLCLMILSACGKKGPLKPMHAVSPNPPKFLTATMQDEGIVLTFLLPKKNSDKTDFDLKEIEVFRADVTDEGSFCKNCDEHYTLVHSGSVKRLRDGYARFIDKGVDLKGLYYYKVRVVSRSYGVSEFTAPVKYKRTD